MKVPPGEAYAWTAILDDGSKIKQWEEREDGQLWPNPLFADGGPLLARVVELGVMSCNGSNRLFIVRCDKPDERPVFVRRTAIHTPVYGGKRWNEVFYVFGVRKLSGEKRILVVSAKDGVVQLTDDDERADLDAAKDVAE